MGPSSGSYIVAANPRRLRRANQSSRTSTDSNETDETSTIGRECSTRAASSGEKDVSSVEVELGEVDVIQVFTFIFIITLTLRCTPEPQNEEYLFSCMKDE